MTIKSYLIVTPCKNEESNLPSLIDSVLSQSLTPTLWIIFNDGSTDRTPEILRDLEQQCSWVRVFHGNEAKRDLGFHYAQIVNLALEEASGICKKNGFPYSYVALIDADMILEKQFFEKIISHFEQNPQLGVASGSVVYDFDDLSTLEKGRSNLPIGGLRVWRKECLEESGGFPLTYSADAVSNVLAILCGWDTKKFEDVLGLQTRMTSSAEGLWKGRRVQGESDYFRDYHPLYVISKFVKYTLSYPFYTGLAYMEGYLKSVVLKKEKITLPEVRKYYRSKHKEIFNYYIPKKSR